MHTHSCVSAVVLSLSLLAGCGAAEPADDTRAAGDDIAARVQGLTFPEGSPEALGVLRVANESSEAEFIRQVKLTTPQAVQLAAYRAGADGKAGTADDRTFKTVAEIDAVPGIGEASINKLLAYAQVKGYWTPPSDDPFDPASCTGASMTAGEAAARLGTATSVGLGAYKVAEQRRYCPRGGACGAWDGSAVDGPDGQAQLVASGGGYKLALVDQADCSKSWLTYGADCSAVTASVSCGGYYEFSHYTWDSTGARVCSGWTAQLGKDTLTLGGTVTNRCMRLTATGSVGDFYGTFEYRAALLMRF